MVPYLYIIQLTRTQEKNQHSFTRKTPAACIYSWNHIFVKIYVSTVSIEGATTSVTSITKPHQQSGNRCISHQLTIYYVDCFNKTIAANRTNILVALSNRAPMLCVFKLHFPSMLSNMHV